MKEPKPQSFSNHTKITPLQHVIWLPLSFIMLFSIFTYIIVTVVRGTFTFSTLLLLGTVILAIIPGMLARMYALILQDRLIRTEEQLRYYVLTNKRLDPRISMDQLIGLRFASDDEYVELVEKTIAENLSKEEIKATIKNWRADNHRV